MLLVELGIVLQSHFNKKRGYDKERLTNHNKLIQLTNQSTVHFSEGGAS